MYLYDNYTLKNLLSLIVPVKELDYLFELITNNSNLILQLKAYSLFKLLNEYRSKL